MKRIKHNYFTKYSESILTNIKNTWKCIKSIISVRSSSSITPALLTFQNETIDDPKGNANIFKNNQPKIKYSFKNYPGYFTNENPNSIFLSPTDKQEIKLILPSLDIRNASGQ